MQITLLRFRQKSRCWQDVAASQPRTAPLVFAHEKHTKRGRLGLDICCRRAYLCSFSAWPFAADPLSSLFDREDTLVHAAMRTVALLERLVNVPWMHDACRPRRHTMLPLCCLNARSVSPRQAEAVARFLQTFALSSEGARWRGPKTPWSNAWAFVRIAECRCLASMTSWLVALGCIQRPQQKSLPLLPPFFLRVDPPYVRIRSFHLSNHHPTATTSQPLPQAHTGEEDRGKEDRGAPPSFCPPARLASSPLRTTSLLVTLPSQVPVVDHTQKTQPPTRVHVHGTSQKTHKAKESSTKSCRLLQPPPSSFRLPT